MPLNLRTGLLAVCLFCGCGLLCTKVSAQDLSQYGIKKGLTMGGGLNFNSTAFMSNTPSTRAPFNWFLSGNININAFGYNMPFSFALSNASRSYTQPFNRIQFRPYWKWVKVYWGNSAMNFSPLTLAGHMFNGYGVELTKNKWQFSAMHGKLKEAVEYDPAQRNGGTSFKRVGWGFKGSYRFKGGDDLSIIFFTAKDDTNSLKFVPLEANITPKENYVGSIAFKKKILKKFNVQFEYAVSGIITDRTAPDKPLVPSKTFLGGLLPQKSNLVFYDAIKAAVGYAGKKYTIQLQYERVTPEYQTLGAYFFNNDIRNITIAPTFSLLKGKVNISGNLGFQKNNLDDTKNSNTRRFVGSGTISYAAGNKWNFNATFNNFTSFTNIRPQQDPLQPINQLDTLNFYQVSKSVSFSASHSFGTKEIPRSLSFNSSLQVASDEQAGTQMGTRQSDFISGNIAYTQSIPAKNITFSGSANLNISNASGSNTVFYGPNINVGTSLFSKMVKVNAGGSYNKNITNGKSNSAVWNARMNLSYVPKLKSANTTDAMQKTSQPSGPGGGEAGIAAKKFIKVTNPLKGKQTVNLSILYMNKLPTQLQRLGYSECSIILTWGYNF